MKKLLQSFLIVALGMTPFMSNAQYNIEIKGESINAPEENLFEKRSQEVNYTRGSETINDTNRWAWARTINQQGSATYSTLRLRVDNIKGFATYFDIPNNTSIDISGLDFFARSVRADNQPADVSVKLYQATPDSMVSNLIDSVIVPADTFTGNLISGFAQSALFSSSHTVSGGFFLALEVNSTDSIDILRGATGSGAPDYPSALLAPVTGSSNYFSSSMLGQAGAIVSHVYPYVEYQVTNSISTSVDTISSSSDPVTFTSSKNIDGTRLWSIESFINLSTSYWSLDGATWGGPTVDTTSTFNDPTINHTVLLDDSITTWSAGTYVVSESVTIIGDTSFTAPSNNVDLELTNLSAPANAEIGDTETFTAEVTNNGPNDLATGTVINLDWTVDGNTQSTSETLSSGLMSGNNVTFTSPSFTFNNAGATDVCVDFSTQLDTTSNNNDVCETTQVDDPSTGINSLNEGNIKVYRSQNMLNVEVNGNLNPGNQDLFIYNVAGQLVKSSRVNLTANSTSRVSINELNSGLYIVKVADETVRFVK